MPIHSRKIRKIYYIKSRIRPKSGDKINNIHRRARILSQRVAKEGMTKWLSKTIAQLETKALHYNLQIKVLATKSEKAVKGVVPKTGVKKMATIK